MINDNIKSLIINHANEMDFLLKKYFPDSKENQLLLPAAYSLFSGGKRLRSLLIMSAAERYNLHNENIERMAVAIELIHSYSLIHDDLPCMDNDDYRRGKLSCHKKFGEAQALLAGDCLLNLAYEILLAGNFKNNHYSKAINFIAQCAGYNGMIGGQYSEIISSNINISGLLNISKGKTCALFNAAIVSPALYANKSENEIIALQKFADNFGIAFQISDDLIDYQKNNNRENTINFFSVFGVDESKRLLLYYIDLGKQILSELNLDNSIEYDLLMMNANREY
jgi:Geranylgeranyl pyrophosphate synthase